VGSGSWRGASRRPTTLGKSFQHAGDDRLNMGVG
jgi:hypothetical protein